MTDQVLDILKLVLLALLYLFFARVLWAVWSEVRQPANIRGGADVVHQAPASTSSPAPPQPKPGRRSTKAARGKGGIPGRLVILEPKERRGTSFAIGAEVGIGRDADNTIVITGDSYISGRHARISLADGCVIVEDLESRNGTYLNGTRLAQRQTVHPGDRIQVGYTVLEAQ